MRVILHEEKHRERALELVAKCELGYEVVIRPYRKDRSQAQSNLKWLWMGEIKEYLSIEYGLEYSKEELYDYYCEELMGVKEIGGREVPCRPSTTKEYSQFLDKLDKHCAVKGIELSHPYDYCEALGK